MEISYYLTVKEVVPLAHYLMSHSPLFRRRIRMTQIVPPLIFFLLAALLTLLGFHLVTILTALIISVLWLILWPGHFRRLYVRQTLRIYGEGENRALFGRFTMHLEDEGLYWHSELVEIRYKWPAFEQAVFTDTHTFLFLSPVQAVIIPKAAVVEGDYDAFIAALRQHLPPSSGAEIPDPTAPL